MMDTATRPDRSSLDRLAYSQGGYFRSAQAGELGFSKQLLAHHVRSGRFERVRRGLYRLRDYPASPDDQIRVAWMTVGGKAVVSHESALELLGLSDVMLRRVHLTAARADRGARVPSGVSLHTTDAMPVGAEIVTREGITVTSPERSIVDAATAGTAPEQIEAAVIEALQAGLTTEDRLRSTALRSSRRVAAVIERSINRWSSP